MYNRPYSTDPQRFTSAVGLRCMSMIRSLLQLALSTARQNFHCCMWLRILPIISARTSVSEWQLSERSLRLLFLEHVDACSHFSIIN